MNEIDLIIMEATSSEMTLYAAIIAGILGLCFMPFAMKYIK